MTTEPTTASREVNSFEEYTLYSLERSTPALLRMMERGKRVASQWPGVLSLAEAAGLCQEVAALASYQDTLDDLFQFAELEGAVGAQWKDARQRLKLMMESLEYALEVNEPDAAKRLFAVELPEALNSFAEAIPAVSRHVRERYMTEIDEAIAVGIGDNG